jgi:hypothetical protein
MKKVIVSLAVVAMVGIAKADTAVLFPNGDFDSPAGGPGDWLEVSGGVTYSYPTTGGNPNGYGVMTDTGGWGIWVGGAATPISLASLGLTAGQTYNFVQDMKILSGSSIGGLKIESWDATHALSDSGDRRPATGSGTWATYSFSYTINPAATGLKIVPLWGPNSVVGYDNLGAVVPGPTLLAVSITSPANGAPVGNYFTIAASANVYPGTVTNVNFYDGATLLGNDTTSPYSYFTSSNVSAGPHTMKAMAYASTGTTATNTVNITVTNVPLLVAYEPFNYPLGAFANNTPATGTGLSGNWTVGNGTIVAGLTYPSLPVTKNAIQAIGGRDVVSFASPVSSGTKYISFLFNQLGNNGGNLNGLFLTGSGATSLIVGITAPFYGTVGGLGLGAVATTSAGAAGITTFSGQQINTFTYNQTHLIVLQIDFNTSGANDTVSLWLDPTAGVAAPAGAADLVWSAFDVGTLSGIGFNIQGGGNADQFDEIHVGNSYGEVVGDIPMPLCVSLTSPTNSEVMDASYSITAIAAVTPGTVINVDFYDGATLLGNASSSPYIFPASGMSAGAHALKAVAQDNNGNSATSSVVNITVVVIPPTVVSAYESFNYTGLANGNASTATGFTGNGTIGGTANIIGDMTYPSLSTTNNAFEQSFAGQRDVVSFGTPLVSGTVYLSFLYNQTGNNGGNVNGLYLPGSGANSLYVGLTGPWSGAAGKLGLGSVTTATAGATGLASILAEMPAPSQLLNYNQTNLIVVKIEFNTSGANDTVSLWLNPTAAVSVPAGNINDPNPDLVVSSYDVGTITGIGFNFNGGGAVQQYDEIRVANTYGEVVGVPQGSYFGPGPGSVSLAGGNATVVLSGIEGYNYSSQRATDVLFTHGIKHFPTETAPVAGNVSVVDDFSDLGVVPGTAFYRLQYIP